MSSTSGAPAPVVHPPAPAGLATCAQAQAFLSISKTTLWRMECNGLLVPVRFGSSRTIRYRWTDLHRLAGDEGGAQ